MRPKVSVALLLYAAAALGQTAVTPRPTLGTLAPGRYTDIVAVRGDVLTDISLLQRVDVVLKNGVRVR